MGKCGLVRVFRDGSYALEINGVVIISDDDIDPFAKNIRAASARSSWSSCGPARSFEQLRRSSAAARVTSCSSCARTLNERRGGEGERTCGWKKNSCCKIQAGWSISTEMWDEVPAGTVDPGGDDSMPRYATPSPKPEPKRRPKAKAPVACTSIMYIYIVSNVIILYRRL